jgi:predicted SAM-dependent methyltransferase
MKIELTSIQQANTFVQTIVHKYNEFNQIDTDKQMSFELNQIHYYYALTFTCISKLGKHKPLNEPEDTNQYYTTNPIKLTSFATIKDILDIEAKLDQIDSLKIIK